MATVVEGCFVEKIGCGVKPSLFVLCNFYDLVMFTEKKVREVASWANLLLIISWKTCESLGFTYQKDIFFHCNGF
jgi:hypothetical protein